MTRATLAVACSLAAHGAVAFAQWKLARWGAPLPAMLLYALGTLLMLASYAWLVRTAGQARSRADQRLLDWVPVVLLLGWILVPPTLSIDPFSYDVYASQFHAGENAYLHGAREAAGTELGRVLATWGWRPVHGTPPYGPVWLDIMRVIAPISGQVPLAIGAMKLIAALSFALTAWLTGRLAPEPWRQAARVAVWWNPLLIIESAGEAHNDALMVVATVSALWYLRHAAPARAAVALTIGILTKWVTLLLAPLFVLYAWTQGWIGVRGRAGRRSAEVLVVTAAVTVAAFAPVWVGLATFNGLRDLNTPRFVASTTGALTDIALARPPLVQVLKALALVVTLAAVTWACWRTWRTRAYASLLTGCAVVLTTYVLIASPLFWAWYLMLPIALLALAGDLPLVFVLTLAGRMVAPIDLLRLRTDMSWDDQVWFTTVLGLWLPLAFVAIRSRASAILESHADAA